MSNPFTPGQYGNLFMVAAAEVDDLPDEILLDVADRNARDTFWELRKRGATVIRDFAFVFPRALCDCTSYDEDGKLLPEEEFRAPHYHCGWKATIE